VHLETFLSCQTPLSEDRLTRAGKPAWSEGDLAPLLSRLRASGLGWIDPKRVQEKLKALASPAPWWMFWKK
jgi:hypothetical protein